MYLHHLTDTRQAAMVIEKVVGIGRARRGNSSADGEPLADVIPLRRNDADAGDRAGEA